MAKRSYDARSCQLRGMARPSCAIFPFWVSPAMLRRPMSDAAFLSALRRGFVRKLPRRVREQHQLSCASCGRIRINRARR